MSYTQRDEEEWILKNTPERGSYLDVGAFHEKIFSTTRALFERGWSGALIEPSPECFVGLMKAYDGVERVKLVNALATVDNDALTLFHSSPDAVGTSVQSSYGVWNGHAKFQDIYIPAIPLNKIIATLGIKADFISIDTEGSSFDLLQVLNLDALGCNLVCVEADSHGAAILKWFDERGFKIIHQTAENMIAKRQ